MKLFGTSGIRGPGETLFTNAFCIRLGYVFGLWLKNQGKSGYVAVANDPRETSPRIKKYLLRGLAIAGWEILDQGVIPTPALTYFVKQTPSVGGGIMITGSHIAADLNGVKLFIDGEEVTKDHEADIEHLFSQTPTPPSSSSEPVVKFENTAKQLYSDMLKNLADTPYPKWKIVVDTANGAQTQIVRDLFLDLDLDFTCSDYCDIQSPHFIPRDTEVESHFSDLCRQVVLTGADIGIGFDLDGDRVIFVDHHGRFIPGDYSCSLIAKYSNSPCVVTTVSASSVVDHLNLKVYRTPVGSTHVAAAMKQHHCTFGFEPNGGSLDADIIYGRDGGATAIMFLNLLKKNHFTVAQAFDSLPRLHLFREKVDCPFDKYSYIYDQAKIKYKTRPISDIDGVKIDLGPDEWLLFRGSGNAPEFRIFAESPDPQRVKKIGHDQLAWVKSLAHSSHSALPAPGTTATDSLKVLSSIEAFPHQCRQVISDIALQNIPHECYLADQIVVSGMGGSALGGRVIASMERQIMRLPITVSAEYHLPNFVNPKTLVVISSYSGNTAETLASLHEARARGAQIYIITSGGKLAELMSEYQLPGYVFTPKHNVSGQPRMGLGYNLLALILLLTRCQLIHPAENLDRLPQYLTSVRKSDREKTSQLASQLVGKIPVLIASEHLKGAAHTWKNQLNENAKTFATLFDLPEANHHLLEGLRHPPTNPQSLAFVFFTSSLYHPELKKLYPVTMEAVRRQKIPVHTYSSDSSSQLYEVFRLVQAGAYLAYYLSQNYSVDPGPIPWVDWYKDEIRQMV